MESNVIIPARYNGPPQSGNGGFSCGVIAKFIDGPARVRLHVPPPLDVSMRIVTHADGAVEMFDGDILIGSGKPIEFALDVPASPSIAAAQEAMSRYAARDNHVFSTCFVCGTSRQQCDGLALFPGPVASDVASADSGYDWNLLACVWKPETDCFDDDGCIRTDIMWAALDCPGFYGAMGATLRHAVLGQLDAKLERPVSGDEALVVYSWPLGSEGRKHYGGTAIATQAGEVIASAFSTWIELKQ